MKQALLITTLLVCIVFVIGIILGNSWNSGQTEISKTLKQSELYTESFLVEQELFESFETNCALAEKRLSSLSDELWKMGKILGAQNAKQELGEENYNFLKRKYHLMQIRTYVLDKKLQQDCGIKTNIILFYFKQDDTLSEQQGKILDELVEQYPLHVFAIEYQYSKELEFLEDYYEIKNTPTLVVNFEKALPGLNTKEQLIPLLHG
ncbi:MAG: hypothetical protein NTW67_00465 [Candidatus Woesearchaeota archaeon]|nr:hypothetical protein [Candidatus Woesearchaeota archaeon]